MKGEILFILLVILGLVGLTAFRYRKAIGGIIGFARMLREAKQGIAREQTLPGGIPASGATLVNCSRCGVWVPQTKARKVADVFYCSDECVTKARA